MKKRKFQSGGNIEDDEISLEQTGGFGKAAVEEAAKRPTYRRTEGQVDERDRRQEAQASMAKPKNFGQAFAAARRAGDKTFMFNGKKFTTELAKPKDSKASKAPSKQDTDKIEAASKAARMHDEREAYMRNRDPDADKGPSRATISRLEAAAAPKRDRTGLEVYADILEEGKRRRAAAREATKMKSGGMVSASKRADGCAIRGKTRGRII